MLVKYYLREEHNFLKPRNN